MNPNETLHGPQLDQLVATKVMGWEIASTKASYRKESPDGGRDTIIMAHDFRPSESIAHAWEVVEKMRSDNISLGITWTTGRFSVCQVSMCRSTMCEPIIYTANADTAPMAICLCALQAVGLAGVKE